MAVIMIICTFLIMCDEEVFIRNYETFYMILITATVSGMMQYLIRTPQEHTFVNSLPVTKKDQWRTMYLSLLSMTAVIYIAYIVIVYIRCNSTEITFGEIAVSGFVKGTTAVFAITLVLWILSHTDFHFSWTLFVGSLVLICGAYFMGELIQKAFNTGTNNFVYTLITYWKLITVPLVLMNNATKDFGKVNFESFSEREKMTATLLYLFVILMITAILAIFACKNYSEMKLEKNMNKGYAKRFSKILVGIFAAFTIFGVISLGIGLSEKLTLRYRYDSFCYEDNIPETAYAYNDFSQVEAYKDGEIYYYGLIHKNDTENHLLTYKIYEVEFPKEYLYAFWINLAVSVIGGILITVVSDRLN